MTEWIDTTHQVRNELMTEFISAIIDEAWTLKTDSLQIVIQKIRQRKTVEEDFRPNWIMRCSGSVVIGYHDLDTPLLEMAKLHSICYLKKKLEQLSLELEHIEKSTNANFI